METCLHATSEQRSTRDCRQKKELADWIRDHWDAIQHGDIIPYYVDECHVCGTSALGYGWAPSSQRVSVILRDAHARTTYFGALHMLDGSFVLAQHETANGDTTVAFLNKLRKKHPGKQLLILWDNASYHRKGDVQAFLDDVNMFHEPDNWRVICKQFAPYASEQNPIEHVWQIGKQALRTCVRMLPTFHALCERFEQVQTNIYQLADLHMYIPADLRHQQSI